MTDDNNRTKTRARNNQLYKALKWVAIGGCGLLAIILVAIGSAVAYLTPERLTPMVKEYAPRFINADVDASRVELFFWSTFPRLNIEVDDLRLVSHAFDRLERAQRDSLPVEADSLLRLDKFRGGINILALLRGAVKLHDIEIHNPAITLVKFNDEIANYDITTPSEESDTSAASIPEIALNRFAIIGGAPIRYISVNDSIDANINLTTTEIDGSDLKFYKLDVKGLGAGKVADLLKIGGLPFAIDGNIKWRPQTPGKIELEKFEFQVGGVKLTLNAQMDFTDSAMVDGMEIVASKIKVSDLMSLSSELVRQPLQSVETNLTLSLRAKLNKPYSATSGLIPDVDLELDIPEGSLTYDRLQLNRFAVKIKASVPDGNLDMSHIDIERFMAVGRGIGFGYSGDILADGDISNPLVSGRFEGGVNFNNLPRPLLEKLPFQIFGLLTGDANFKFKPSQLTGNQFHTVKVDGHLKLGNFKLAMRDSSVTMFANTANLNFGANTSRNFGSHKVDSLFSVTLNIDTASYVSDGITFTGKQLHAGLGGKNVAATMDTTQIMPLGLHLNGKRLILSSDSDSIKIRLRELDIKGSVRRYRREAHKPLVNLEIGTKNLRYSDRLNRATLRDASIALTLHPRKRPQLSKKQLAIYDSISYRRPNLTVDSIYSLTVIEWEKRRKATSSSKNRSGKNQSQTGENIDFGVDNSLQAWLKLWEASGRIEARSGRAFTPYFPVRNKIENVSIKFNNDSININSAHYRSGRTNLELNGCISNITSAVTSKRGEPIKLRFNIDCDTLDINQFAEAIFAGSAFAEREDSSHISISDSENEEEVQKSIEAAAQSEKRAFVVPSNVDASINLNAKEVLYADIWFQNIVGRLEMANGAVHLDRFGGFTEMGTIDLTLLYSAPDVKNVDFAAGMVVRKLDLKKFLHMLPEVDSLLPLLQHVEGIITADVAMTTELDSLMDIKFHTLKAALKLEGDSLVVIDSDTFKKLSKWLLFKRKDRNMIDHMSVEMLVNDSYLQLLPFVFDFDRYKLGVWGGNDLDMNYDYHVAVLKSPIPFKFGITVKGKDDHFKVKLGRANFDPDKIVSERQLTDTTRINLISEIQKVFKFGVNNGKRNKRLTLSTSNAAKKASQEFRVSDTFTHADSVLFMQEGVIPMTSEVSDSLANVVASQKAEMKKEKKKKKK